MSKLAKDSEDLKNTMPLAVISNNSLKGTTVDAVAAAMGWDRNRAQAALRDLAIR